MAEGGELDRGVESEHGGIGARRRSRLHRQKVQVADPEPLGLLTPALRCPSWLGKVCRPIHEEHRFAVHPDVAAVCEGLGEPSDVLEVVVGRVGLANEYVGGLAIPRARPVLVRPAQAEREVRLAGSEDLVEGPLEQAPPLEPVVVVAEAADAVSSSEICLRRTHLRDAEIVEAEVGGYVGLVVSSVQRISACDVDPVGEPFAPPLVVLGNRVELG